MAIRTSLILLLTLLCLSALSAAEPVVLDQHREAERQFDYLIWRFNEAHRIYGRTKRAVDPQAGLDRDDHDPVTVLLRRTRALMADLQEEDVDLQAEAGELAALGQRIEAGKAEWSKGPLTVPGRKQNQRKTIKKADIIANRDERLALFTELYLLQRQIALRNPALDFDRILFVKHYPAIYSHMVDQYFGADQQPGGGVFILQDAFSEQPKLRDVLAGSTVSNDSRLQGRELEPGSFMTPELSADGTRIWFAYTETKEWTDKGEKKHHLRTSHFWDETKAFHLFRVGIDGSDLSMLTDGRWNDFDPCQLPNGRIAFISERRGGEGRCHPRPCPTYVLHSMLPDGSDIVPLSLHETNEWSPVVSNDGRIVYSRWDYVDRHIGAGQHPWVTTLDGRDARAIHGNYDEARLAQVEDDARPIPDSSRFVATLHKHHTQAYGSLAIFDTAVSELVDPDQTVRYLTPEADGTYDAFFATGYPLNEDYFLCAFSPEPCTLWLPGKPVPYEMPVYHGLYLIDRFGTKTLLYRDEEIGSIAPIPVQTRTMPPAQPHATDIGLPPGEEPPTEISDSSTMMVMNVYDSLRPWPENRDITSLRVVQVLPKNTPCQDNPPVGYAEMMNTRFSLGTVPVESDGSAHFTIPAGKLFYLQALDRDGLAIQTMRTAIYTHPGETLACVGCHERPDHTVAAPARQPLAMRRPASHLTAEVNDNQPFSFPSLVQPVLDAKCVSCHAKEPKAPDLSSDPGGRRDRWTAAYRNLQQDAWYFSGRDKEHGQKTTRSTPGEIGAVAAPLYQMLTTGSHKDKVALSQEEMARITLWLDLNAPFLATYGDYRDQVGGTVPPVELE